MTSIIKVDQIQLSSGTTPRAEDLGVDVSGTVLNTHYLKSPSLSAVAIANSNYNTLDTFTLDVIRDNSRMIWTMDTQQYIKDTPNTNPFFRLTVDGVSVAEVADIDRNDVNQPGWYHAWYGQNAGRETQYNHFITKSLTAGTHTFAIQAARYASGTITLKYQGGAFRYIVQEIAG